MTMAHVLRDLREQKDLTQAEVARRAGVNPGTVYRVESGLVTPNGRTLWKLARALEVPIDTLRNCGPGRGAEE